MRNDGGAPMELGDGTEIDGEGELDLLPFSQAEIGRFDEHSGGAEIDRFAQFPATIGQGDVNRRPGAVPRVHPAFQGLIPLSMF